MRIVLERLRQYKREVNDNGFSLLELVIAVGIVLVMTAGGLVAYAGLTKSAREAAVQAAASEVFTGARAYQMDFDDNTIGKTAEVDWNASKRGTTMNVVVDENAKCLRVKATHVLGEQAVRQDGECPADTDAPLEGAFELPENPGGNSGEATNPGTPGDGSENSGENNNPGTPGDDEIVEIPEGGIVEDFTTVEMVDTNTGDEFDTIVRWKSITDKTCTTTRTITVETEKGNKVGTQMMMNKYDADYNYAEWDTDKWSSDTKDVDGAFRGTTTRHPSDGNWYSASITQKNIGNAYIQFDKFVPEGVRVTEGDRFAGFIMDAEREGDARYWMLELYLEAPACAIDGDGEEDSGDEDEGNRAPIELGRISDQSGIVKSRSSKTASIKLRGDAEGSQYQEFAAFPQNTRVETPAWMRHYNSSLSETSYGSSSTWTGAKVISDDGETVVYELQDTYGSSGVLSWDFTGSSKYHEPPSTADETMLENGNIWVKITLPDTYGGQYVFLDGSREKLLEAKVDWTKPDFTQWWDIS